MSSRNTNIGQHREIELYQIGIRCLAATGWPYLSHKTQLYQIGIRCLAATKSVYIRHIFILYQIGIRCLAATTVCQPSKKIYYIR